MLRVEHYPSGGGGKYRLRPAILHYSVPVLTLDLHRQFTQLLLLAHLSGLRRNVGTPAD